MAAHVLALFVVISQPVASVAWLGGMHATLEQAALHQAAVEHGHYHHHGALEHHEHQPQHSDGKTDVHVSRSILGPEFASAVPYAGSFQDLLQTLFQAMLARASRHALTRPTAVPGSSGEGAPISALALCPTQAPDPAPPHLAFVQE